MAASYMQKLDELLYTESKLTPYFELAEKKTGVKRTYYALGFIGFLFLYLLFGYGGEIICNFIGFVFPAYKSIKAIESTEKDDDTQWLTYWVVYGAFMCVEFFSDIFLYWFPFYYLAKLLFLGWCMAPYSWNGSHFVYYKFLLPLMKKHETKIDGYIQQGAHLAQEGVQEATNIGARAMTEKMINDAMSKDSEPQASPFDDGESHAFDKDA